MRWGHQSGKGVRAGSPEEEWSELTPAGRAGGWVWAEGPQPRQGPEPREQPQPYQSCQMSLTQALELQYEGTGADGPGTWQ